MFYTVPSVQWIGLGLGLGLAEIKAFVLSFRFGLLYSSIGTVDWTAVQWLGLTKIKAFVLSCIFDVLYSSVCTVEWTGAGAGAGRDKGRT